MSDTPSVPAPPAPLTVDVWATWYEPRLVLTRVMVTRDEAEAKRAIWARVKEGVIRTAAREHTMRRDYQPAQRFRDPALIPNGAWVHQDKAPDTFWHGDGNFGHHDRDEAHVFIYFELFTIRLNPADVDIHFPPAREADPATATEEPTKPRIQDDWLKSWADVFNRLYPQATEDFAVKSAKGMFHDKQVARDRVRPLLPQRRPGRRKE